MLAITPSLSHEIQIYISPYPLITGVRDSVSVRSLGLFFYDLAALWAMFVSFIGWGRLLNRLFRMPPMPASVAGLLGIATVIFLGGLLNLLHAICSYVLFAIVALGLLLYFALLKERPVAYRWRDFWRHASPIARALLIVAILLLALRVAGTVRLALLNGLDDGPAYLLFPHKMLQTHSFAFDPFSERRMTTSLGGGYFLQAFIASMGSLANIGMADRALGLLFLGITLFDFSVLFDLSAIQFAWLELLTYLVPQPTMNLTFVVLPVALLLGIVWMLWQAIAEENSTIVPYAFFAGLLGGASITLKSTYLPCIGAFFLVMCATYGMRRKPGLAFGLPIIAGLGAVLVLFAWMVAMKLTSGTYLYPIFGRGFDYSRYGLFPAGHTFRSVRTTVKIFLQGAVLLFLAFLQLAIGNGEKRRRFSAALLIAAAAAIIAFNFETAGDSIWRYNFPQFFSVILVFYIASASVLKRQPRTSATRVIFFTSVVAMVAMIFYYDAGGKNIAPFREVRIDWNDYRPSLRASLSGRSLESPQARAEYVAIESTLSRQSTALANTAYPFLFNYRIHKILIADWPGAASPPPGWPFHSTSEDVAEYLRQKGIQYVIYDYVYGHWMDAGACNDAFPHHEAYSDWLLQQLLLTVITHNQFDHLRVRYRVAFDDGKIAVIDLNHRTSNARTEPDTWTLDTPLDEMCPAVIRNYLAHPLAPETR